MEELEMIKRRLHEMIEAAQYCENVEDRLLHSSADYKYLLKMVLDLEQALQK